MPTGNQTKKEEKARSEIEAVISLYQMPIDKKRIRNIGAALLPVADEIAPLTMIKIPKDVDPAAYLLFLEEIRWEGR